jgi:hypothetical protein
MTYIQELKKQLQHYFYSFNHRIFAMKDKYHIYNETNFTKYFLFEKH